jgi:hypothetical protein
MEHLNERIIHEINNGLPNNVKPVNYLMDILCIGKESAYRRLKNQIPFTFEEVAVIANDLKFSIDTLVQKDKKERIFFDLIDNMEKDDSSNIIDMFKGNIRIMEELGNAANVIIVAAINHIPMQFFPFEMLFKLSYCRYLHSNGNIPLPLKFSDISIPSELKKLHEESVFYFDRMRNITCIVDNGIFTKTIKEIQYYYQRNFISREDLSLLQKELIKLLNFAERLIRTGANDFGSNYFIYYSSFSIDTNCVYYEYDGKVMSQIWLYLESPIIINESRLMCEKQKRWMDAKMKYSVLISKSNDILQSEIIRELSSQINNMVPG